MKTGKIIGKYTDAQYAEFEYFQDDDIITHQAQKLVTTRKEHECSSIFSDPHLIQIGEKAIRETAIDADIGRVSNYICLKCCDEYLDEVHEIGK